MCVGVVFQLFYTTVFGWLSAFVFLRTGHVISVFLMHWFCNHMGFPRLDILLEHKHRNSKSHLLHQLYHRFDVFCFMVLNPSSWIVVCVWVSQLSAVVEAYDRPKYL
jgi:hypothetical protein